MEAERRTATTNTRKRKPLADRTNISTRSSPSLNKLPQPPPPTINNPTSTAAAAKPDTNQNSTEKKKKTTQQVVDSSSIQTRNQKRRKLADTTAACTSVDDSNKENVPADVNIFTDVSSSPSTPSVRQSQSPLVEPLTVYGRRQNAKNKGKEKVISEAFTCQPVERKRKEFKVSKCLTELPKKRRTKERVVSKEYFEQQRAYFAEIDKCELPEEEVSESELSDH